MSEPALKRSDVVFMYKADDEAYRAYGATFVGWGGAMDADEVRRHHDVGVRCAGNMWTLTAGAKLLHDDPEQMAATARDIQGEPVEVPWLQDHTYRGTRTYFGCTNHPTFRALNRQQVRKVLAGGPDGLHVDDHLGAANAAVNFGGGFCDHCMAGFREYLARHSDAEELATAGVRTVEGFDYRDVVRALAPTREQYLKTRRSIPLMNRFEQFHVEAAAENFRQLGELASEVTGHDMLLSGNACLPHWPHTYAVRHMTHVICEVAQRAGEGTARPEEALLAYRAAEAMGKPLAATAHGGDWAYVKAHEVHELVRYWIALAYAHGQRFMVPHPTRQWALSWEHGTHWYAAPIDEFAPVYRFVRANAERFDGYAAAETQPQAQEGVIASLRIRAGGPAVMHLVNRDYDRRRDAMRPSADVTVRVPTAELPSDVPAEATVLSWDADPQRASVRRAGETVEVTVPELRLWSVVVLG
ncbi:MAG: hypothetical protein ACOC8F_05455 [Planctomycetota bacterium]